MAFTRDWFSNSIPSWNEALAPFKGGENLRFLEIGSFEGRSSCWLLENVLTSDSSVLHCVDPWVGPIYERFIDSVSPWKDKVVMHRGKSEDMLPLTPGPFDLVYIDGLHMGFNVLQDAVLTWNKLKVGGLMIFDDYLWEHQGLDRTLVPKDAVDGFLSVIHGRYELLHLGYQVIIRKNGRGAEFEKQYFDYCQSVSADLSPVF
ncbi:class I SAM-dependent methyltransferase [Burkholderia cenocepacia]|uniref:class I SAM-dependent methyltransferase n=1 Tax=Burkholderia cenocepacia TaxID=95486 RepID=UPI0028BB693F|nr:class I SAM-dependent methyltransferase [Burkholderia cenocepacia]MDT6993900.1 class I SAM-dependent methyltransferase [Burkholderia cenocepacia]